MDSTVQMLSEWVIHDTNKWLALVGEGERDGDIGKGMDEVRGSVNLSLVVNTRLLGVQADANRFTGSTMKVGSSVSREEAASADDSSPRHLPRKLSIPFSHDGANGLGSTCMRETLILGYRIPFSLLPCPFP